MKFTEKALVIHPFLVALSVFIVFVGVNLNWFQPSKILGEIALVGVFGALLFLVLKLVFRLDWVKFGLVYSSLIFLYFTLADAALAFQYVGSRNMFGSQGTMTNLDSVMLWIFLLLYLPVTGLCIFLVKGMSRAELMGATNLLNALTIGLILFWGVQFFQWEDEVQKAYAPLSRAFSINASVPEKMAQKPDVYFIILDGCASQNVLKKVYGYDDSAFIQTLEKMGFYIAKESRSNYLHTHSSVTSTLNCAYLDELGDRDCDSRVTRPVFVKLASDNALFRFLKQIGYKFYFVSAADAGFDSLPQADRVFHGAPLNDLILTFASNSPLRFVDYLIPLITEPSRKAASAVFDLIDQIVASPGPKLVFMHVNLPHPPYLFAPDGKRSKYPPIDYYGEAWALKEGYVDQVRYIEKRLVPTLQTILKNSTTPPVIIVQGDHGPAPSFIVEEWWKDARCLAVRAEIFNAVYLPPGGAPGAPTLNPRIGPINTMKVVLDRYFGANLPLLPERNFLANYDSLHKYQEITKTVNETPVPDLSSK